MADMHGRRLNTNVCCCSGLYTYALVISPTQLFWGVFAKLQKATIKFVMSVCPSFRLSVRMEQLGSYWTNSHAVWYLSTFRKSVDIIEVLLQSDTNSGCITWRPVQFCEYISLNFSWNEKCFRQVLIGKIKTHILCAMTFFFFTIIVPLNDNVEDHGTLIQATIYNIMWGNMVQSSRPQFTT